MTKYKQHLFDSILLVTDGHFTLDEFDLTLSPCFPSDLQAHNSLETHSRFPLFVLVTVQKHLVFTATQASTTCRTCVRSEMCPQFSLQNTGGRAGLCSVIITSCGCFFFFSYVFRWEFVLFVLRREQPCISIIQTLM